MGRTYSIFISIRIIFDLSVSIHFPSYNIDVGACLPHLWTALTIPPEWEDILTWCKVLGNFNFVFECPVWSRLRLIRQLNLGPLRSFRKRAFSSPYSLNLFPFVRVKICSGIFVYPRIFPSKIQMSSIEAFLCQTTKTFIRYLQMAQV